MTLAPSPSTILGALARSDYLRRAPPARGALDGHKEWLHFCVYGPELDLLVNYSVVDDLSPTARGGAELARLTVLARSDGGWRGGVERCRPEDVAARGGRVDLALGESRVALRDGGYHLRARLREPAIAADLVLRPAVMPSLLNNIVFDAGAVINWLVLPRLHAQGTVEIAGRTHRLDGALAYHDHNWGHFAWGRDFAWEWGFALPEDLANPYSVVFVRLSDRAHTRALMQAVFLWDGARILRVFRATEVAVRHEGWLRPRSLLKIPQPMALLSPDLRIDVPRRLLVEARDGDDLLELAFTASDSAQVVIPNDRDLGITAINEVSGRVRAAGRIGGVDVALSGRAIFEFLGA